MDHDRSIPEELAEVEIGGLALRLPRDWTDITDDLEPGSPPSLALPDGVGVLQFSVAWYAGGVVPNPEPAVLAVMLAEFATAHKLCDSRDEVVERAPLTLAAATFSQDDASIRAWYVSDGRNFAKFTFTSTDPVRTSELMACEAIVRSTRWLQRAG